MAEHSLDQLLDLINQQVKSQELLREYLSKATSLIRIALEGDFLTHPALIVYHYLWALDDFVEMAREACEGALKRPGSRHGHQRPCLYRTLSITRYLISHLKPNWPSFLNSKGGKNHTQDI